MSYAESGEPMTEGMSAETARIFDAIRSAIVFQVPLRINPESREGPHERISNRQLLEDLRDHLLKLDPGIELPEESDEELSGELSRVLLDVLEERKRQDAKWGGPEHDDLHTAAEWREFRDRFEGEAIAVCDYQAARESVVKIAALAIAQVESLDRHLAALNATIGEQGS